MEAPFSGRLGAQYLDGSCGDEGLARAHARLKKGFSQIGGDEPGVLCFCEGGTGGHLGEIATWKVVAFDQDGAIR